MTHNHIASQLPLYLVLQSGYTAVHMALYEGPRLLERAYEDNKRSSKNLIPLVDTLLRQHGKVLSDCQFISVYQGPAPFTTLRVVIASANGLAFATRLSLVGIDGLKAFLLEQHEQAYDGTVVLLNAFCGDVYWGICDQARHEITTGCASSKDFFTVLKEYIAYSQGGYRSVHPRIKVVGNGLELYRSVLVEQLGDQVDIVIPEPVPDICSLETVAQLGLARWLKGEQVVNELLPLYLKSYSTKTCISITS